MIDRTTAGVTGRTTRTGDPGTTTEGTKTEIVMETTTTIDKTIRIIDRKGSQIPTRTSGCITTMILSFTST